MPTDRFDAWSFLRDVLRRGVAIDRDCVEEGYEVFSARLDAAARELADKIRPHLAAAAPQYAAALCEIGIGPFRREWLDEAEALWAARETNGTPDVWAVRCRELLRCMMAAHQVAGTDPADPEAGPVSDD